MSHNFYVNGVLVSKILHSVHPIFQMVASAEGHVETAVVLARWSAGTRREAGARAAAAAARRAGHSRLAAILDRIHPPTGDAVFRRPHRYTVHRNNLLLKD